ncbi:MAG: hypothetical protein WAW06_08870 [bacterium]
MAETEKRGVLQRLLGIDRRILFIIIAACVVVPLLTRAKTTISVTPPVRGLYEAVDQLEPGSYVWLAADYDPGSMPELYPMNIALVDHLMRRDVKIISASLWSPGAPLSQRILDLVAPKYGKTYGVDYVNLGFKEGREAVMLSAAENIRGTFPQDFFGTRWDQIPMLEGIRNLGDVKMIVAVSAGYPGLKEWIQQVGTRFGITIGGGVTAVTAPEMYPYIQSGQIVGLLAGMKGAAEYEQLVARPGLGIAGMVAQSSVHVMVVAFIVFANVVFLVEKRRR